MPLVVPPGFGLASFIHTGAVGTQPYVCTLGIDFDAGVISAQDAANRCFIAWSTNLGPEISSQLTLDRVSLFVGDDGPSGSVDSDLSPVAMSRAGTYPPTSLSAIVRKVTAEPGRRGRGRMFLPGAVSESEVDQDGTVVAARRATLTTAMQDFGAGLVTGGGVNGGVVFHSTAPFDPTPIVNFAVSDLVGWIRGRIR